MNVIVEDRVKSRAFFWIFHESSLQDSFHAFTLCWLFTDFSPDLRTRVWNQTGFFLVEHEAIAEAHYFCNVVDVTFGN